MHDFFQPIRSTTATRSSGDRRSDSDSSSGDSVKHRHGSGKQNYCETVKRRHGYGKQNYNELPNFLKVYSHLRTSLKEMAKI
jgi:hypothetical protein